MKRSLLREESYLFAILIVRLAALLQESKKEFVLSKQVLRSGTAIGAHIREAEYGQTISDFVHKMSMALKEANETDYWISILHETGYVTNKEFASDLQSKCRSLISMLAATVRKAKAEREVQKNNGQN